MSFIFVFADLVYRTNDTERLMCPQCTGVVEAASNWTILRRGPDDDDVYIDDIKFTNSSIQVAGDEILEFKNLDTYSEGRYSCQRKSGECLAGCIFIQGNILYYVELGGTAWEVERGFGTNFFI